MGWPLAGSSCARRDRCDRRDLLLIPDAKKNAMVPVSSSKEPPEEPEEKGKGSGRGRGREVPRMPYGPCLGCIC